MANGNFDASQSTTVSTIAITHEQYPCVVRGYNQLLREIDLTIVALLHLTPASSLKVESLESSIKQEIRAQNELAGLDQKTILPKPTKLILKSFKDEELFADEVEAYRRLRGIQGNMVPILYGCGVVDGLPTIILEYISGEDLIACKCDREQLPMLAKAVENCSTALTEFGVVQADIRLDCIIVTDLSEMKVKMIDFSHVEFDMYYTSPTNRLNAQSLMREYAKNRGWAMPQDTTIW
jgi:serine/threonine protein kinase